jgi:hypothetical protein
VIGSVYIMVIAQHDLSIRRSHVHINMIKVRMRIARGGNLIGGALGSRWRCGGFKDSCKISYHTNHDPLVTTPSNEHDKGTKSARSSDRLEIHSIHRWIVLIAALVLRNATYTVTVLLLCISNSYEMSRKIWN